MKAAVLPQWETPLEIQHLADPTPGPTDVVVQVEACGICRTDWHIWRHDFTWLGIEPALPHVLGHEFGGVVLSAGEAVKDFKPGDRVTIGPEERTPEAIRAAVHRVLPDLTFRANAKRLQAEIRAIPGPETAVSLLERLASSSSAWGNL